MPDLLAALERYGDQDIIFNEHGAVAASEIRRRALAHRAEPSGAIRPGADDPVSVVVALLAGAAGDRPVLLSTSAEPPAGLSGFEILLLTSGTSGRPKMAAHDLDTLTGRIKSSGTGGTWLLTYSATAFAGLQVVLTAMLTGGRLVTSTTRSIVDLFKMAVTHGVTHASATPTFWRGWLLASGGGALQPPLEQITIGGEAVDQTTLDRLAERYPHARITHIYASTEAGSLFSVNDRRAGFPGSWLEQDVDGVCLRIADGLLEVKSPRRMRAYRSQDADPGAGDGWLRTGDLVERHGDRVLFCGRGDRIVNVGGYKVAPERVERVLLEVAGVADAYVYPRPNAVTGQILMADLLADRTADRDAVVLAAQAHAEQRLAKHERPARFTVVDSLQMADSGKKTRA
jgi:acyl-CoA synthetase (AMP-forming)/AMP-acid ligase II